MHAQFYFYIILNALQVFWWTSHRTTALPFIPVLLVQGWVHCF